MSLDCSSIRFGNFLLDTDQKVLLADGKPVPITPKTLELLFVLLRNHGRLVEKAELMDSVWAGSFVEESNLTFTIRQLRKVLGDDRSKPKFIQTVPRRGYRFIGDVRFVGGNGQIHESDQTEPATLIESRRSARTRRYLVGIVAAAIVLASGLFLWAWFGRNNRAAVGETPPIKFETVATSVGSIAAISPDGSHIAFVLRINGRDSLWTRDLSNGSGTQLVAARDEVHFYGIKFSPDSQSIYYIRRYKDDISHLDQVPVAGGTIKADVISGLDYEFSIAPDGRRISFRRHVGKDKSLLTANIDGTDPHEIFTTTGLSLITDNVFSPDGKLVAFASGESDTGDRNFGVFVCDAVTGELKPATDFRWYYVRGILWLPDQSGLLVTGRLKNNDTQQVWKITLADGRATQITDSQNSFGVISATADLSRVLVVQSRLTAKAFISSLSDPAKERLISHSSEGVAWVGNDKLICVSFSNGNNDLWLLDIARDTQQQLTTDDANEISPAVSVDQRLIAFVSDRSGRNNIWTMNVDGSNRVQLTNGSGEQAPAFSPDGRALYYNQMTDRSLWKMPLDGSGSVQIPGELSYYVAISPDNSKFAHFAFRNHRVVVLVRSFDDPNYEKVLEFPEWGLMATDRVVWTRDGTAVIYAVEDAGLVSNLWRQSLADGRAEKLTNYDTDQIFDFAVTQDESQLAVSRGSWNFDLVLATGLQDLGK